MKSLFKFCFVFILFFEASFAFGSILRKIEPLKPLELIADNIALIEIEERDYRKEFDQLAFERTIAVMKNLENAQEYLQAQDFSLQWMLQVLGRTQRLKSAAISGGQGADFIQKAEDQFTKDKQTLRELYQSEFLSENLFFNGEHTKIWTTDVGEKEVFLSAPDFQELLEFVVGANNLNELELKNIKTLESFLRSVRAENRAEQSRLKTAFELLEFNLENLKSMGERISNEDVEHEGA